MSIVPSNPTGNVLQGGLPLVGDLAAVVCPSSVACWAASMVRRPAKAFGPCGIFGPAGIFGHPSPACRSSIF